MYEIGYIDFMAAEHDPVHCGQTAQYVDSGIWECRGCDAYAMTDDDDVLAPPVWKNAS